MSQLTTSTTKSAMKATLRSGASVEADNPMDLDAALKSVKTFEEDDRQHELSIKEEDRKHELSIQNSNNQKEISIAESNDKKEVVLKALEKGVNLQELAVFYGLPASAPPPAPVPTAAPAQVPTAAAASARTRIDGKL